ncbi:hypothetical protein [Emcibacter sp. SYSU 3D8]|uniref:hypothetical protein n=1 Tax=Emcibacter sp. SYSU 3D8 TaxID=3133969 RepID=UPI0031FEE1CB
MKGMWKIVLPVAVMGLALSACEKKTEEAPVEAPAVEAPAEPMPEAPMDPAAEAPMDAPVDGMAPPADESAPEETKEGAPTP